jgi:pimeloyl-ACP methyl ester carboxylesterase
VLIDDSADPVIAGPTRQALRERYRASRHFDIAGGGHFPANLQPEAYVEAIRAALA